QRRGPRLQATLGRRDAQTAAPARDQRSEHRDQIRQALAFVETRRRDRPDIIADLCPLISVLWTSRKEVIQPQVPLRLPCYDFTPVADLTVVGCPPFGSAYRLRVKPTPMA